MKITDIPQDIEPRVGDIIEIEQGEDCFEVRIIGITADGYLCEQDNVRGAVLLESVGLNEDDAEDIEDFLRSGGSIQQLPYKGSRKERFGQRNMASRHIGGGSGEQRKGKLAGLRGKAANVSRPGVDKKPVVTAGYDPDIEEGLRDPKDNPCWKGYHPVGTKQKNGRTVPNCVPNAKESVEEAGPFSYGAKKPRRGSVADLADKKRREQEKNRPPIEPKDQMVGTAKLTKDVSETSDYFRRREREEAIISGQKPARKKQPAQTSDYARRREQEKKAEKGVAEGYTGRETKEGTWRVFRDGEAVAVAGPFKSREEAGAWIKKQKQGVAEGAKWRKHPDAYNVDDEGNKTPRNPNSPKFGYDPLQRRADTANDAKTSRGKTAALKTSLKMAQGNKGVAEGLDPALDQQLTQLARNPDFDAIYDALGRNDALGARLQDMADDIARDYRLHMDDDIERIIDILADRLENDYGQDVTESGLQYHTGVKKHGAEYMRRASQAGREGASQEEIGRLRDRYSKAYKKNVKEEQLDEYSFADKKTYMKFLAAKVQKYGVQALKPEERTELIAYLRAQKMTRESGQEEHEYSLSLGSGRRPGHGWDQDSTSRTDRLRAQDDELKQSHIEHVLKKYPELKRSDLESKSLTELIRMLRGDMNEAEYQGRKVPLNKKMKGDVAKSKVYVRKPNGKVVKVNFGDPNMRIKKSDPKRRKSFRARHNCENPGPKWKARYWSCKSW